MLTNGWELEAEINSKMYAPYSPSFGDPYPHRLLTLLIVTHLIAPNCKSDPRFGFLHPQNQKPNPCPKKKPCKFDQWFWAHFSDLVQFYMISNSYSPTGQWNPSNAVRMWIFVWKKIQRTILKIISCSSNSCTRVWLENNEMSVVGWFTQGQFTVETWMLRV